MKYTWYPLDTALLPRRRAADGIICAVLAFAVLFGPDGGTAVAAWDFNNRASPPVELTPDELIDALSIISRLQGQAVPGTDTKSDVLAVPLDPAALAGINLIHYVKLADDGRVRDAFDRLHLRAEERASTNTNMETNAIWFGSGVSLEAVYAMSATLMDSGVALRVIAYRNTPAFARCIVIGYTPHYWNSQPVTRDRLYDTVRAAHDDARRQIMTKTRSPQPSP